MAQKEKKLINHTFMRFLIVGGSSTILDFIVYWFLSREINYNTAKAVSMSCSCFYSYILNKSYTFQDNKKTTMGYIARYTACQIINICVNTGINSLVYKASGNKSAGMLCAAATAMTANYLLQKYFVFRGKPV